MECEWQFKYASAAIDGSYCAIQCPAGGAESTKQYYNFFIKIFIWLYCWL